MIARLLHPGNLTLSATALLLALLAASPSPAQVPAPVPAPVTPGSGGVVVPSPSPARANQAGTDATPTTVTPPALPSMPTPPGAEMDRVVATVNGYLILDSDVDQERRFAALLPYGEAAGPYSREEALQRLINRELILQQARLQPQDTITTAAAEADLDALRKSIPNCKQFQCETQAGWDSFLATQGFTEASIVRLWRQRMEVLAFIELRFRMGLKVSPDEIAAYYNKTLLPQYAALHATPAPLSAVSNRIQQVLLEQKVTSLLDDWLESLRAQGSVVVLHPGEVTP